MTLTLQFPPDLERRLHELAAERGQDVAELVLSLLESSLEEAREEGAVLPLLREALQEAPALQLDADGVVRVGNTRVTLDTVVGAYRDGASAEEIVRGYDVLTLPDVRATLDFYTRHREQVDEYLAERERQREKVRQENLARWPQAGLRERLLARRSKAS